MVWNYRIIKEKGQISIREVYYSGAQDELDKISWTAPVEISGGEKEDLLAMLQDMKIALDKPTIHILELEQGQYALSFDEIKIIKENIK